MTTNKKYLYVTKFVIPQMLWQRICDLPESEQFRYAYIASFIKVMGADNNRFHNINISYKVWLNTIGSGYRRYVDDLLEWNVISIQTNDNGSESYCEGHHAKCYSLTLEANKSGWLLKDYHKRKSKSVPSDLMVVKNGLDLTDPIISYTYASIELLVVDDENNIQINNIPSVICLDEDQLEMVCDIIRGEHWLRKLDTKNYTIDYGKRSGRLYHPVICMPKTSRQRVWFKDSDVVMDYDVKSCFPVLLTAMVPESEKAEYKKILDGDIYASIISGTKHDRDDCKVAFQQFINGFVSNYVSKWFAQHFPLTYKTIEGDYANMSQRLQTMESLIIVKGLIPYCIENHYTGLITCHDGWMTSGTFKHSTEVESFVKNEIFKVCGYMPVIKSNRRQQSAATPFPIRTSNNTSHIITDEEEVELLQNREYRTVYYAMRGADRERKQWARRLHQCKDYENTVRRQREAKQRYIHCLGEWVKLLENFLQIKERK
jgi:hypothetical protein